MASSIKSEFGTIRSFIWPVHKHEYRKLVPMLFMICLVVFVYDILRNMKDAVVVTTAGAEVLPFIKVWALLPGAICVTLLFAKLSNRYSQESVFYTMISGFLVFFAFFALVIYPFREALHADRAADALETVLPAGFKGMVAMCRYWSFTLFYVVSELWGSIVLSVLFWGFANEVTRIGEARRFYSVFCIGANSSAFFAGLIAGFLPEGQMNSLTGLKDDWTVPLMILTMIIVFCGIITMGIFRWMNKNVLNDPCFEDLHKIKQETKTKKKLSLRASFSYLSNSKYLICIAVLVISYNLVLNLVEVIWKDLLRKEYPATADYFAYMSHLTSMIGIVSASTAIFMARIIDRFGWTFTALITPVLMLITSTGFFSFMFFQGYLGSEAMAFIGATPLSIAVFFGAAQSCFSKAMKYSVFDSTKEMAFIPLSHESKLNGKAAIDGVGSRMGKSGGSLIHTILLMLLGSLTASAPYIAAILVVVIGMWVFATRSLGKQFAALTAPEAAGTEPSGKPEMMTELTLVNQARST
jgi:ATP:ADP antiporter, AAA family